jgi:hypothetical protein
MGIKGTTEKVAIIVFITTTCKGKYIYRCSWSRKGDLIVVAGGDQGGGTSFAVNQETRGHI